MEIYQLYIVRKETLFVILGSFRVFIPHLYSFITFFKFQLKTKHPPLALG